MDAAFGDECFGIGFADHAVGDQHFQHFGQFQFVFWNVLSSHIHTLIEVGRTIPVSGGGDNRVGEGVVI